jgi:hypothetical protein
MSQDHTFSIRLHMVENREFASKYRLRVFYCFYFW